MKIVYFMFGAMILLVSCGDVGKALRNEKTITTDEFLVKKRGPLVLPPNYEEIPKPDTIYKKKESQKDKLKDILKAPKKKNTSRSSTTETSILEKIRK